MPRRPFTRDQGWLLPPSLGELIGEDHPVRFVAEFVSLTDLAALGIRTEPAEEGAPSYAPEMLLALWLYGFMCRTRSSRKIERACQENICFMWLAGRQRPDHCALARFYQRYRQAMRPLFGRTVRLAVEVGLVDFALHAVDGTRLASASKDSLRKREGLERLLALVEQEILAMEESAQREAAERLPAPPPERARQGRETVRARVQRALLEMAEREQGQAPEPKATGEQQSRSGAPQVSVSDPEAILVRGGQGLVVGYNAQIVSDSKAQIVVAADVVACSSDTRQLLPMVAQAEANTGQRAQAVLADGGYHSADNVRGMAMRKQPFYAPDPQLRREHDAPGRWPYHKSCFRYEAERDVVICPQGQVLRYSHMLRRDHGRAVEMRVYRGHDCRTCPAFGPGQCTQNRKGRRIALYGHEQELLEHREKMAQPAVKHLYGRRKAIVEPVFGQLKEQVGARRFLLRGLTNVQGEWNLLCSVHNLLKLWRHWWRPQVLGRAGSV